jgi:hypothetical protein
MSSELQAYSVIVTEQFKAKRFINQKEYKKCVISCKKLVKYGACDDEYYTYLGTSLHLLKRDDEAMKYLKKIGDSIFLEPARLLLGKIHFIGVIMTKLIVII